MRDLFNPKNPNNEKGLRLRENPRTGPYIEDLKSIPVRDYKQLQAIMDGGSSARTGTLPAISTYKV